MELRWVTALREHGQAYGQCLDDLEGLKRQYHDDLARSNPEKPYTVAGLQGQIRALDDLIQQIKTEERKEQFDARRQLTTERRLDRVRNVRAG